MNAKEFLEYILKGILKHPDELIIAEYQENGQTVFDISVNPEDVGQIIGKDGRTIKSIKILLSEVTGVSDFILKVIR